MLASFLNSLGNTFDLRRGDEGSLAYLACTSPLWLPVPSSSGSRYTHYSAHQVLRKFGFDQDISLVFKEVVPSLHSLDPFLRLQAFSYWSQKSPQFVVPNSQRGVFTSSGLAGYWRRVQKSFLDFVGFSKIERVLNSSLFSTPTFNKHLALPTAGIMFVTVSNKKGFMEWHASRGGWVCYMNDFPDAWTECDLIMGASSSVPIKRGIVEAIGATIPLCKGKEKKIKQEAVKRAEIKESVEGTKAGLETKKRKTAKSRKQLVVSKEPEKVDPSTVGKKVGHPLIPKIRMKTKVESSIF